MYMYMYIWKMVFKHTHHSYNTAAIIVSCIMTTQVYVEMMITTYSGTSFNEFFIMDNLYVKDSAKFPLHTNVQ